jgi:transposase
MNDDISWIGLDVHAASVSVAIARTGRDDPEYFGKVANTAPAIDRLIGRLEAVGAKLRFCYEAGPTGFALYRQIMTRGHDCLVAAPSMIPRRGTVKPNQIGDVTANFVMTRTGGSERI